jgi:hypothetical protein
MPWESGNAIASNENKTASVCCVGFGNVGNSTSGFAAKQGIAARSIAARRNIPLENRLSDLLEKGFMIKILLSAPILWQSALTGLKKAPGLNKITGNSASSGQLDRTQSAAHFN